MADPYLGLAFAPDESLQYEPDTRIVGTQASVDDGNEEHMVAAQLANDNSWRSGDIDMVDATDMVSETGSSLSSSSLSSGELDRLIETHAPEILSGSLELNEAPSPGDSSIDPYGETSDDDDEPEQRAATPQSESGIDMLDKFAFNFNRDAYNHRVPRHLTTGITLNVGMIHAQTSLAQHRQKLDETGEKEVCPSLAPLKNEMGPPSWSSVQCVWVGMLPSQASSQRSSATSAPSSAGADSHGKDSSANTAKKSRKKKTQLNASIMDLGENSMTVVPFDRNALRVVGKKSNKVTKTWSLYALVNPSPRSKLCQGYRISMDDVYFFKDVRDDLAKTNRLRKQATQRQIRSKIFPTFPSPDTLDSPGSCAHNNTDSTITEALIQPKVDKVTEGLGLSCQAPSFNPSTPQDIESDKHIVGLSTTYQPLDGLKKTYSSAYNTTIKTAKMSGDPITSAMMVRIYEAQGLLDNCSEDGMEGKEKLTVPTKGVSLILAEADMEYRESSDYDNMDLDVEAGNDPTLVTGGQGSNDDYQGYSEHSSAADDSSWDCYRKNLVDMFNDHSANPHLKSRAQDGKALIPENSKSVLFQDSDGQILDKYGERLQAGLSGSAIAEDHYRDDNGDVSNKTNVVEEASKLSIKIMKVVNRLTTNADIAGLGQALTVLKSLEHGIRPSAFSVLGLYLNIPPEGDSRLCIDVEDLLVRTTLVLSQNQLRLKNLPI